MMTIRPAAGGDAEAIAMLSGELGYPAVAEDVDRRLSQMAAAEGHAIYVAEAGDGSVVGWIHVFGACRLESEPFAELGGLVVAEARRGCGIGRMLCERASRWARDSGFPALRVRTRVEREATHRFYERVGFRRAKSQHVFTMPLAAG